MPEREAPLHPEPAVKEGAAASLPPCQLHLTTTQFNTISQRVLSLFRRKKGGEGRGRTHPNDNKKNKQKDGLTFVLDFNSRRLAQQQTHQQESTPGKKTISFSLFNPKRVVQNHKPSPMRGKPGGPERPASVSRKRPLPPPFDPRV